MRRLLSFILTMLIFYVASAYFPKYVYIKDIQNLLLATILMFALGLLYRLLVKITVNSFYIYPYVGCLLTVVVSIVSCFWTAIRLFLISVTLPGFEIHGLFTYIILCLIFMRPTIKIKTSNSKKD